MFVAQDPVSHVLIRRALTNNFFFPPVERSFAVTRVHMFMESHGISNLDSKPGIEFDVQVMEKPWTRCLIDNKTFETLPNIKTLTKRLLSFSVLFFKGFIPFS